MTTVDTREATRRRLIGTLFAGNAIGSTAYIGVATVGALIAEDISGSTGLSGLAPTTGTLGVALGAAALSWAGSRIGRRPTFTAGYVGSAAGAALVIISLALGSFPLLLLGMLAVGVGRAVGQLARYAAGDMRTAERRGGAISLIVWASTIAAIIGPPMIGPAGSVAELAGFSEYAGPAAVAVIGFTLASILMGIGLRPDPLSLAVTDEGTSTRTEARPARELLADRDVQLSIAAIVVSQVVMVFVMVMTPIHIKANDGTLSTVGWVMMAHTIGMFAIAPITGILVNRYGPKRMITAAVGAFVVSCALAATAVSASTPTLLVSMFLLGVAWNFGFVAGSTLLQQHESVPDRLKLQGIADSSAWIASAVAAAASGVIVAATSYSALAIAGGLLALLPLVAIGRHRTA